MPPPPSLKARALQLLAQRDRSRLELRRKLLAHARKLAAEPLEAGTGRAFPLSRRAGEGRGEGGNLEDAPDPPEAEIDAVLDDLEAGRYLSDARFVESRVAAREARFGNQRIRLELARHGTELTAELAARLKETELERATRVYLRRFGSGPPQGPAERAARQRFLAARGFSGDVIRRVLRTVGASSDAAPA